MKRLSTSSSPYTKSAPYSCAKSLVARVLMRTMGAHTFFPV
jgi:hypothetical protein